MHAACGESRIGGTDSLDPEELAMKRTTLSNTLTALGLMALLANCSAPSQREYARVAESAPAASPAIPEIDKAEGGGRC